MRRVALIAVLLLVCAAARAQTPPASATSAAAPAAGASITTLETVTVTGVMPGPGLWKVTRGTHVLWILGVVPVLPAGIEWQSSQVAQAVAASQTVLEPPGVKLKVDTNWLGKLFLLPSIYHAKRNPDGKTLKDVLMPDLYARWETAKQRYFGDDHGIERYRPILAAAKLMKKAQRENGLRGDGEITEKVVALAKQHGAKLDKPQTTLEIKEPRQAVKAFAAEGPDGVACLALVLDVVERQLPEFRARANAWATGDLVTLRKINASAYRSACQSAITGAGFAKALGIDNLPGDIENAWLTAANTALAANAQTFAVLPMHDLLDAHGYLAALQARGYTVTAPDAADASTDAPASAASAAPAASAAMAAPAASIH